MSWWGDVQRAANWSSCLQNAEKQFRELLQEETTHTHIVPPTFHLPCDSPGAGTWLLRMNIKPGVKTHWSLRDLETEVGGMGGRRRITGTNGSHAAEDRSQPWQRSLCCSHRTRAAALSTERERNTDCSSVLSPQTKRQDPAWSAPKKSTCLHPPHFKPQTPVNSHLWHSLSAHKLQRILLNSKDCGLCPPSPTLEVY